MRLIDADALIQEIEPELTWSLLAKINSMPTVDAVPVIRCRDCDNRYKVSCPMRNACVIENKLVYNDWTEDDGFCVSGEPKEDTNART